VEDDNPCDEVVPCDEDATWDDELDMLEDVDDNVCDEAAA